MARVIGQAGRGAAVEAIVATGEPVFVAVAILLAGTVFAVLNHSPMARLASLAGALIGLVLTRRTLAEMCRRALGSRAWWRGYEGERRTGEELAKLGDEYVVLHDYAFRDGDDWFDWNVDHIVVGPTGVFVLDTKNPHRMRVRSAKDDARTARHVLQVRRNAMSLKERLVRYSNGDLAGTFIEGWVVYAQAEAFVDELSEGTTHVVPLRLLNKHIEGRRKPDVDTEQAYRVVRALYSLTYPGRREVYSDVMRAIEDDQRIRVAQRIADARAKRAEPEPTDEPEVETCPWCGAVLVQKTAHRGRADEHEFMSCSAYPRCRFGYDLPVPRD